MISQVLICTQLAGENAVREVLMVLDLLTVAVLGLAGFFLFRPLVNQTEKQHQDVLLQLEDTLGKLKAAEEQREVLEVDLMKKERFIRACEARYYSFVESAQDFIHETDYEGRFIYVNPEIAAASGYAREELYQMHYWDLLAPENREEVREFYYQQYLTRTPVTYREVPVITKNGCKLWIGQKVSFDFEGDRITSVRTIGRNLTELKTVQQEAQRLQQLMSSVLDSSLSGIIVFRSVTDEDTRVEDFEFQMLNPSAALLLERDVSDLIGKSLTREFPVFLTDGLYGLFRDVVENDEPHSFEFNLVQESGHSYWLQMVAVKMGDGLMVTFNDIHERKEAELQVERQKEFYETILNSIPTEISVYDPQQSYLFANPAAIPDDKVRQWILGRDDFQYCHYLGKELALAYQRKNTFVRVTKERRQLEWEEEAPQGSGPSNYYFRQLSPVFDADGQLRMIISFGVNISERKRIEEELNMQRELFRKVIDTSPNFIFIKNWNGEYVLSNRAIAQHYGLTPEKMIGKTTQDLDAAQDSWESMLEEDRRIISYAMQSDVPPVISQERRILHLPSGEFRWYQFFKTPFVH